MDVYVMADEKMVVHQQTVHLRDIAKIYCVLPEVSDRLNAIEVCNGLNKKHSQQVIDLYELLCGRLTDNPDITIHFVGVTKVLVEYENPEKSAFSGGWTILKIMFACCICFFGAIFTIMAFHNDIGIGGVFENTYTVILGHHPDGIYVLELAYSVGLATGIILFFNHFGGKRISRDPTPVEVAMKKYEEDVNRTVIEQKESGQKR